MESQALLDLVNELTLSDSDRERLLAASKQVKKAMDKNEFRLKRTLKDKSIVVNLLNKSLEELEEKNSTIEKVNRQLTHNLQELKRSYREMEQFAYIASHDLKSPLRSISNFAQLLQRRYEGKLDKEADDFIGFIVSGVFRMNSIIGDLLEYSKVGNKETIFEQLDLNKVVEMVQFNLASAIRDGEATLLVHNLPIVMANESAMIQLFQNLIGNAIKFQSDKRKPVITIKAKKKVDGWYFTIADNGVGIDKGYQNKAFLPFQRINNLERPGTGIGLAICKKVMDLHHGKINYESTKGEGTVFHIDLPFQCPTKTILREAHQSSLPQ